MLSHFSRVRLFASPWTIARQAPLPMGFSRQEYWSGLSCLPPGDLPDPGIELVSLMSPVLVLHHGATWEAPDRSAVGTNDLNPPPMSKQLGAGGMFLGVRVPPPSRRLEKAGRCFFCFFSSHQGGAWPKSGPWWSEVCEQEQLGISSGGSSGSLCPGPSSPWAVGEANIWWWRGWGAGLGCHGVFKGVQGQQQQLPLAQAVLNDPDAVSGWVPSVPRPSSKPGSPAILTILSGPPGKLDF